jgi:hypothetical protein
MLHIEELTFKQKDRLTDTITVITRLNNDTLVPEQRDQGKSEDRRRDQDLKETETRLFLMS